MIDDITKKNIENNMKEAENFFCIFYMPDGQIDTSHSRDLSIEKVIFSLECCKHHLINQLKSHPLRGHTL